MCFQDGRVNKVLRMHFTKPLRAITVDEWASDPLRFLCQVQEIESETP